MIENMFEKSCSSQQRAFKMIENMFEKSCSFYGTKACLIFQVSGQTWILDPQVYSVSEILTISPTIAL